MKMNIPVPRRRGLQSELGTAAEILTDAADRYGFNQPVRGGG